MPDFKLEIFIREVSDSDLQYIVKQMSDAVEISGGKLNDAVVVTRISEDEQK